MPETNYGYPESETNQLTDPSNVAKKAKDAISDTAKTVKDKTQEFGRAAVDKIEENRVSAAGALRNAAVKRNPGPSLLMAAAFGFILGRALRNNY